MLDPVNAVSLVSAIVQFIEFSVKVAERIEDFRNGLSRTPKCLYDVHAQVKLLTVTLPKTKEKLDSDLFTKETKEAILEVVLGCQKQVKDLETVIGKLLPQSNDSKLTRHIKALTSLKTERRIKDIDSRLQRYTQILTYHESTNIYRLESQQEASPSDDETHSLFDVPFSRDDDFIGREDILLIIQQLFQHKTHVAITGIGGVGKSQVAIEYCYRFLDQSPKAHVFWINAGSVDRFEQGFKRIARKLELPGWNGYAVNPCELVKDWFQVEAAGEWLLVLDGIDDMDTVFPSHCSSMERSSGSIPKYIPRLGSGRLLLTSRDKRIGTRITSRDGTLKLNQPSLMESSSLLQRKIHDFTGEPLNFEVLVKELSCLPLAVTQAAAYMNESCIDTSTYIKLLREEESPAEILEEELGDVRRSYDDNICSSSVYRTFQISFERLRFQNDQAAELLALIGSLEGCAVPVSLLRGEDKASNPSHLTAVALLESLSLIEFQKGRQALSLHRLVHLCIRRWLQLNCTTVKWHNEAMLRVFKAFPRFSAFDWAEKGMDRWTACEILLPHALLLLRNTHLSDRRANLQKKLHVLVVKYKGQRSWREPLANEIQEIYYYFGANDLKWHLRTCDELVLLRREQGRYAEAVQVLEQALQTTGKQPVTNTAVALQARLELAFCLYGLGNFKKSTEVLNATREASRLSNDGEDSFRQCRCDEIQGMLTASSGSPVAALTLFENVVQWKVETLGEKHRTTLNSKRNLFMTLVKAGRFIDAETMGQDTVAAFTEVEGSAHPRTIWVKCVLAETFMFLDKFKAAERLSLDILQKPLEKSKTKTRYIALFVLMSSYWSQGRDEERNVIEEELCVFVNEKTRADKGDIDGLNLLLELGSYFHRRGKGATGKMLVEACLHAQEHASAEEIDLEESKLRLHEIVSCKCRGVDVTMGCWQPRCKYRGIGFQGIINPRVRSHKVSKKQESRP